MYCNWPIKCDHFQPIRGRECLQSVKLRWKYFNRIGSQIGSLQWQESRGNMKKKAFGKIRTRCQPRHVSKSRDIVFFGNLGKKVRSPERASVFFFVAKKPDFLTVAVNQRFGSLGQIFLFLFKRRRRSFFWPSQEFSSQSRTVQTLDATVCFTQNVFKFYLRILCTYTMFCP